jgi:hypothetical protein
VATLFVLVSLAILIALAMFFWKQIGPGSGRAYGNRIARQIGLPRNTFWYLLENGADGTSMEILSALKGSGSDLHQAGVELGPTLQKGLKRLEARFGVQEIYEQAKPVVARLVASHEQKAARQADGPGKA